MDRRQFLRMAGLIAAGVVAADQLELLERLAPRRLFTTGGYQGSYHASKFDTNGWVSIHNGKLVVFGDPSTYSMGPIVEYHQYGPPGRVVANDGQTITVNWDSARGRMKTRHHRLGSMRHG